MIRLPLASFSALVAATVAAFFITQHLKVTTPLLAGFPRPVPAVIDPLGRGCGGADRRMHISFWLQHRSDDVDVWVVNSSGSIVATLASNRHMRRGVRHPDGDFSWNGRLSNGRIAPDGTYYVRVALIQQGRTIDIASIAGALQTFKVQTHPPRPRVLAVSPALIAPRPDAPASVRISYAGNEHRGGMVQIYRTDLVGPPRLVKSFLTPWKGESAVWDGLIANRPAPAGIYLVGLDVTDAACNTGRFPSALPPRPGSTAGAGVTVRYLAAQPPLDPGAAGTTATVFVDSRHQRYRWQLVEPGARRPLASGASDSYSLPIRLPRSSAGLYELRLSSGAHSASVPLVASSQRPARLLVVLPALTWQGLNPGDEDGDGIPDTLADGSSVLMERPFADGLPAGLADELGVLAYLGSVHRAYDLTTDVGLIDGVGPPLAGHAAVLLAGDEEWVTPALAASLRSYVTAGGHVLSLGIDSLRRYVSAAAGRAAGAKPAAARDVFGAQLGPVTATGPLFLAVIRDGLGIFSGTAGLYRGFPSYQPVLSAASPAQIVSEAGTTSTTPAVVGLALGSGAVVEVGFPGFGSLLAHNADAQALLSQILTVLAR